MKNVLSGIQPTGDLHIGNYFGAIKNWVELQDKYRCFYAVVDYHSMTIQKNPGVLRENIWKMAFQLLACGIRVENLFIQSLVPEHTELAWILGCTASYGELTRMTQFKDKTDQLKESDKEAMVSLGLFTYPVLQAADILMYHADFVPVGKDQEQHLELSRNIAQRFNAHFRTEYFKCPEPLFTENPKILSPADPSRKMSKSLGEKHYINLFGEEAVVRKQIRSAVTDAASSSDKEMSAGVKNLFDLLLACGNVDAYHSLMEDYALQKLRYSDLKAAVADALVAMQQPFRDRLADLNANKRTVKSQILHSSAEIRNYARKTIREVREICGLPPLK